jgi:copper(I)-binding protein
MQSWKTLRWLPALLAVGLLAGCSTADPFQSLPAGGVNATTGQLVMDDIWIEGPHGLNAGANAPVRLVVVNESATTGDSLVGVSTPAAQRAIMLSGGHTVSQIVLGANSQTDLERTTGVELQGLRAALIPGQGIPITFTFANAAPVTVQVAVGPLAAPSTSAPSATTPAPVPSATTPAPSPSATIPTP